MPAISDARRAAFAILHKIEKGPAHSDDLLREDQVLAGLADADRRLATTLVLGVLRWQLQLDSAIRAHMAKPNAKLDAAVLIALRMGAFQLLHLDRIPTHAAIHESVELVKRSGYRSAAGLVNALLRKIAAGGRPQAPGALKTPGGGSAANAQAGSVVSGHDFSRAERSPETSRALAPEASCSDALAAHPAWMRDRWTSFFGAETACAICLHDQSQPTTMVRVCDLAAEPELAGAGVTLAAGNLLTAARTVIAGNVAATPAFRDGRATIQDEGSQLVGEIAAIAADRAAKILDACAAPGGKTLILAERNPAAQIVACEVSPSRLEYLRDRLARLGERVQCRLADATALHFESEFDIVLADVPCSGTGTLSRNPEIRHRIQPGDFPRHSERQRAILRSALRALRPGGRVVYSTCSLEPEENEDVVRSVVASTSDSQIVPLGPMLRTLLDRNILTESGGNELQRCLSPEGFLRLMPGTFGTDGFFMAVLEKT